jgi:hypothetical protein
MHDDSRAPIHVYAASQQHMFYAGYLVYTT